VPDYDEMTAAMREVQDRLLAQPGVWGIEVGLRRLEGMPTNELAICVYVNAKRDVPEEERIPAEVSGVRTDVIEGTLELHQGLPDKTRYPATLGGISIEAVANPVAAGGGTLGVHAKDNVSGGLRALSNSHVLQELGATVGMPVVQPARPNGSAPADQIGVVEKIPPPQTWVSGPRAGWVDCGTATLSVRSAKSEIVGIGPVLGTRLVDQLPPFGQKLNVRKRGAVTGLTHGFVRAVNGSFLLDPDDPNSPLVTGDITIEFDRNHAGNEAPRFSAKGDSGSAVVDDDGKVIGLLWGGTADGMFAYVGPIDLIEDLLDVTVSVAPPPTIGQLSPTRGTEHGANLVVIDGSSFQLATGGPPTVFFDRQPATFGGPLNDTRVAVLAPSHSPGQVEVVVETDAGQSAPSTYTYVLAPVVTQVVPATGSAFGGELTTIEGFGFDELVAVSFGVAPVAVVSSGSTQIVVRSPPGLAGFDVPVTVVTTAGGASLPSNAAMYRYTL